MAMENYGAADPEDLLRIQEQINKALHSGKNRRDIADDLARACLGFPCLDCVWIWTHQPASGQMNVEGSAGCGPAVIHLLDSQKDSTAVVAHLMVGHELVAEWEEVWGEDAGTFRDAGFKQVGVLPLNSGTNLIGAIGFATRSGEGFDSRLPMAMGQAIRHFGTRLEILEMEERLAGFESNMGQVFAALDNSLFIVDQAGLILDSNYSINGDDPKKQNIDRVLSGGQRILQKYRDHIPTLPVVGRSTVKNSRLIGENGDQISVDVSINKGMWNGKVAYFMSCRDITQQRVIEKERDRLVTAIEQIDDAIVITNSAGSIQYTNPAFSKLTGYTAEEVQGANPRILKSSRHDHEFYRQMWSTIRRGETWHGRLVNRKKSGEEFWEVTSISPVLNSSGIITHYVCVKRDITNEMKLEERLRQSQKLEAIGTLAGGIAHDFNNILYALLGNSQLALDDIPENHPAHLPLTEIVKAGDRGSALVSKMLAFGQRSDRQMKVCALGPIISEVMVLSRATLPATIEMRMDLADDCPDMLLDETQIHQVVLNLCTNAAHAMSESGGVLTLELKSVTIKEDTPEDILGVIAGDYLRLTFGDTGCGMDSAVLSRVFEPYFTTKKSNEGTGLGLASVHGIVRNHDGRIFVDSTPGEGTIFTIYFPVAQERVAPAEVETKVEKQLMGQGRVMVVDDERMITDVVVRGLRKKGFQVEGFVDGVEALEVFRKDPDAFDVVITDQTMPNITGFELAAHLSSLRPDLPIILSTGYANTVDEIDMQTAGVSHFLSKPLRLTELVALLCEINESEAMVKGD